MGLLKLGQLVVREKSRIRNFGDKRNYMREIVWRNLSYDICIYHFYVVLSLVISSVYAILIKIRRSKSVQC